MQVRWQRLRSCIVADEQIWKYAVNMHTRFLTYRADRQDHGLRQLISHTGAKQGRVIHKQYIKDNTAVKCPNIRYDTRV